jgi:hypothetical protein
VSENKRCRCRRVRPCMAKKHGLRSSPFITQTGAMNTVLSAAAAKLRHLPSEFRRVALVTVRAPAPNPSIERTSQRPLRALCAAAHVER